MVVKQMAHHFIHFRNTPRLHLGGSNETFLRFAFVRVVDVVELSTVGVNRLKRFGFFHPVARTFEEIMGVAACVRIDTENIAQLERTDEYDEASNINSAYVFPGE